MPRALWKTMLLVVCSWTVPSDAETTERVVPVDEIKTVLPAGLTWFYDTATSVVQLDETVAREDFSWLRDHESTGEALRVVGSQRGDRFAVWMQKLPETLRGSTATLYLVTDDGRILRRVDAADTHHPNVLFPQESSDFSLLYYPNGPRPAGWSEAPEILDGDARTVGILPTGSYMSVQLGDGVVRTWSVSADECQNQRAKGFANSMLRCHKLDGTLVWERSVDEDLRIDRFFFVDMGYGIGLQQSRGNTSANVLLSTPDGTHRLVTPSELGLTPGLDWKFIGVSSRKEVALFAHDRDAFLVAIVDVVGEVATLPVQRFAEVPLRIVSLSGGEFIGQYRGGTRGTSRWSLLGADGQAIESWVVSDLGRPEPVFQNTSTRQLLILPNDSAPSGHRVSRTTRIVDY